MEPGALGKMVGRPVLDVEEAAGGGEACSIHHRRRQRGLGPAALKVHCLENSYVFYLDIKRKN